MLFSCEALEILSHCKDFIVVLGWTSPLTYHNIKMRDKMLSGVVPRPRLKLYLDPNQMPKQTASAAQFSSVTNHQSVKRLQAVWLVGSEIGFTLERTQHTRVAFF